MKPCGWKTLLLILSVCTTPQASYGLSMSYGEEEVQDLPEQFDALVNDPCRIDGYLVNANKWFFFRVKSSKEAGRLFSLYADLGAENLRLILHGGKGIVGDLAKNPGAECDLKLDIIWWDTDKEGKFVRHPTPRLTLHVWVGGNIDPDSLEIPKGMPVEMDNDSFKEKPELKKKLQEKISKK